MAKIPFKFLPGSWGLTGKTREVAQAEYELSGFDLHKRLLEIRKDELDPPEFSRKMWDLELKHGMIDGKIYHRHLITLITDDKIRSQAELELDHREGKIGQLEYAKQQATLNGEPWVTVINMDFNGKNSLEGSFELDWNEYFVDKLRAEGYVGVTPDIIVNQWFMEVCRNVALEEFDGTGDFTSDSEANLETLKRWEASKDPSSAVRKGYR